MKRFVFILGIISSVSVLGHTNNYDAVVCGITLRMTTSPNDTHDLTEVFSSSGMTSNEFSLVLAGLVVPIQHVTGIIDTNTYPPVANEWANGNVPIQGWSYIGSAVWPEPGLIVAHPSATGSGHVGIVDYDGEGVAAGERTVNRRYKNFLDGSCGYNLYEGGNQGENLLQHSLLCAHFMRSLIK